MIDLYNGDCLEIMDKLIAEGVKVDAIITDPPYELSNHGGTKAPMAKRAAKVRDEVEFISKGFDYEKTFDKMLTLCKIPNIVMFCSNLQLGKCIVYFENKGLKVDVLTWSKTNPAPLCNGKYVSDIEYILYIHAKGSPWNHDAPYQYKLKTKRYPIITNKQDKVHPTQKPTELMMEFVELHTLSGDLILDPFMGSGTTGKACKNLNRNFIGIELDFEYYMTAYERINNE